MGVTREIPLTKGAVAIVDAEDYDSLMQWKWYVAGFGYAARFARKSEGHKNRKTIWMHRVIAKTPDGMLTDHINGDRLDNRRSNLRLCTQSENLQNVGLPKNNTSGYKGVNRSKGHWQAAVWVGGRNRYFGSHDTPELAAAAYDAAATSFFGEFARPNTQIGPHLGRLKTESDQTT